MLCLLIFLYFEYTSLNFIENCQKTVDFSNDLCLKCSDNYYSFQESPFENVPFPISDCVAKFKDIFESEIFITSESCLEYSLCNGSFENPLDSLIDALEVMNKNSKMYSQAKFTIFFIGEEFFILEKELRNATRIYFRRSLVSLTISPLFCTRSNITGCRKETEFITIHLKSNQIMLFIGVSLRIKNFIFNGNDMLLEANSALGCYSEKRTCCQSKAEFNICEFKLVEANLLLKSGDYYGFFNIELPLIGSKSVITNNITLLNFENCIFQGMHTIFPSNVPRFSCLIKVYGTAVNITLENVLLFDSYLAQGIFIQVSDLEAVSIIERGIYPTITLLNVSISKWKSNPYDEKIKSILNIDKFKGSISIEILSFSETVNQKNVYLITANSASIISLKNIQFRDGKGLSLLICNHSEIIKIEEMVLFRVDINSSLLEKSNFLNIKSSGDVYLTRIFIREFSFNHDELISYTIFIANVNKIQFLEFHAEKIVCLTLKIESSYMKWEKFNLLELDTDFRLLSTRNCSLFMENVLFTYFNINFDFLISIESEHTGSGFYLIVFEGHFSNLLFSKEIFDNGVFEWPIFTSTDWVFMRDLDVFNCSQLHQSRYVNFFIAYAFNKVHFENINFSYFKQGLNTFVYLQDAKEAIIINGSFKSHLQLEEYLLTVIYSQCRIFFANISIDTATFRIGTFFINGNITGVFENFTFTNISEIKESRFYKNITFNFGIVEIWYNYVTFLKNWVFRASNNFKFSPSRFFFLYGNQNIFLQNFSMEIPYAKSDLPEIHLLISLFNRQIVVQRFYAKNFYCQTSFPAVFTYQAGLMSFINSDSFLKGYLFEGQILVSDIYIEACAFCKNGLISLINIKVAILKNISIKSSDNINGGALSIYFGQDISIENLISINTSASQYGGAIFLWFSEYIRIKGCMFSGVKSKYGGTLFLRGVIIFSFDNSTSITSTSLNDGGLIYCIDSNILLKKALIFFYTAFRDGGCIYMKRGKLDIIEMTEAIEGFAERGGWLFAFDTKNVVIEDLKIKNCSATSLGITFLIEECLFISLENIELTEISSAQGTSNLYILISSSSPLIEINNLLFFKNNIYSWSFIYMEDQSNKKSNPTVLIKNIMISDSLGSIASLKCFYLYKDQIFTMENVTVRNFNLNLNLPENLDNFGDDLFFLENVHAIFENLVFENIDYKFNLFYMASSFITLDYLYLREEEKPINIFRPRFIYKIFKSNVLIKNVLFFREGTNTAFFYSDNSFLHLENGSFRNCHSPFSSCLEFYNSNITARFNLFKENQGLNSGLLLSIGSHLILEGNYFKNNSFIDSASISTFNYNVNNLLVLNKGFSMMIINIRNCYFLESSSGISIIFIDSNINITYSLFRALKDAKADFASYFKAILGFSCNFDIISSIFSNFNSKKGGSIMIEHGSSTSIFYVNIKYSVISNSQSDYGGAFSLFGSMKIFISENLFINNTALKSMKKEFGNFGVGIFICKACGDKDMYLLYNIFFSNYAENGVPTIFSNNKINTISAFKSNDEQILDTNFYFNNSDGMNLCLNISYLPFKLRVILLNSINFSDITTFEKDDIISIRNGQSFNLKLVILDDLQQTFLLSHHSTALIQDPSRLNLSLFMINNRNSISEKSEFIFENLMINAELNKSFESQILIDFNAEFLYPEGEVFLKSNPFAIHFFSKPCEIGDIILEVDSSCLKCPHGKFSLIDPMKLDIKTRFNQKCLSCPKNALCSGGSVITPLNGFWRYSNTSTLIVECLSKISCLGADDENLTLEEKIHGKCLDHSSGPLCYICEAGFARFSKTGICKMCSNSADSYLKFILIAFFFLLYTFIQIKITFQTFRTSTVAILLKILVKVYFPFVKFGLVVITGGAGLIWVTHFQQIHLISLVDTGWTHKLNAFIYFQEAFAYLFDDFVPLDCLLQKSAYNIYVQKVVIVNIYPFLLVLLFPICWMLFQSLVYPKNSKMKLKLFQVLQITFFIVVVVVYPEVISKCLSLMTCLKVEDTGKTMLLLYHPEVICYSNEHITYLLYVAVPGLVIWGVLAPFIIALFLFKYRAAIKEVIESRKKSKKKKKVRIQLESNNISTKPSQSQSALLLKFLYTGYSSDYFYWELFVFLKKFLLISIGCVSDLFPAQIRGVALLVLISFLLFIQIRCCPFDFHYLNKLELFSLLTTFLTADLGILMFSYDFKRFGEALLIFILFIHTCFILFWLHIFISEVYNNCLKRNNLKINPLPDSRTNIIKCNDPYPVIPFAEESACFPIMETSERKNISQYMGANLSYNDNTIVKKDLIY